MSEYRIAEIVTFRLNDGVPATDFREAAGRLEPFLRRTGGMIARTLSCDRDGLWTDHILWETRADADRAAGALPKTPEAAAMMAAIDESTVAMRHAEVAVTQT
jgi:hypothetical protein